MSVLGRETHPVARQIIGTLNSSDIDSVSASNFPVVWYQPVVCPLLNTPKPGSSENYDRVITFAPNCGEPPFML
jgi:hypothetical protein